jgi:lipopolysaccharide assembly outer membrane protein LptD (OstA)
MKLLIALLILFLTNISSEAQIARDTSVKNIFVDSVAGTIPLVQPDSVRGSNTGAEDIITYEAKDSLVYDIKERKVFLYNTAVLKYKDLKLEAGRITVNEETEILEAYGMPDTAGTDLIIQQPLMYQGNEKYEGARLTYDFNSQQGSVSMGFSEAEVGYYFGDKIKKVSSEVLFIRDGIYTTSDDRVDPEYYFLSPKMKVIPNDKVIAQSVFLYIEGVPVFWIPFGVFPNRTGRSSGLIAPTFGDDATYGTYISKLGYFWAINDYIDLGVSGSYFTKGRLDLFSRFRYALKYNFNGEIGGAYSRLRLGESSDLDARISDQWGITLSHFQQINPTTRIDGNLSFVSGKELINTSTNSLSELLRQNILSNLTLSKYWEGTPFSANANYYRDQNLQTNDVFERLPLVNFAMTQIFPFESKYSGSTDRKLYENFFMSYSGSLLNRRIRSTSTEGNISTDVRAGVRNFLNFGLSPRFEFITLAPFFNYNEIWYSKYISRFADGNTIVTEDNNAIKALRYFDMGVNFSTRLVGIFSPRVFGVTGIRHTLTPSLTYSYQPDFSSPGWGYYKSYTDTTGREYKYSIFEKEVFGGAPSGESQRITFALGNVFEMKTRVNDSTENKFQLLNLDAGLSYNFAADSLNFSEIFASYRTNIGNLLNISGGATFNLYKFDPTALTRVNRFLVNEGEGLADITNFSISLSSVFAFGVSSISKDFSDRRDTLKTIGDYKDVTTREAEDEYGINIPLSGGIGYNYSESRSNPLNPTKSSNISGNVSFDLTRKWRFTVSTSYDLLRGQIAAPYITAYRDLNSWEMNFNWYPSGVYRGFSLEVRIKAPELRDIKVTKQTNQRGVFN